MKAIGGEGDGLLAGALGPRYPAILPVLLSLAILVVGTGLSRLLPPVLTRKSARDRTPDDYD